MFSGKSQDLLGQKGKAIFREGDVKKEVETEVMVGHEPRKPEASRSWTRQGRTLP